MLLRQLEVAVVRVESDRRTNLMALPKVNSHLVEWRWAYYITRTDGYEVDTCEMGTLSPTRVMNRTDIECSL